MFPCVNRGSLAAWKAQNYLSDPSLLVVAGLLVFSLEFHTTQTIPSEAIVTQLLHTVATQQIDILTNTLQFIGYAVVAHTVATQWADVRYAG